MSKAPAVDYAIKIIEFFAKRNQPIGITDISNGLSINKNAVSRIINSLEENKWIYCSNEVSKKYSLTLRPLSLISKSVQGNNFIKTCDLLLSQLHEEISDSVYMGIKNGSNVIYQLHYDSTRDVRINGCVGGEYPLHVSAPGKVLLAWSEEREIDEYFEKNNLLAQKSKFLKDAKQIKKQGYAIDNEEFSKGIICYAVPIMNDKGEVIASIGVSSLTLYDTLMSLIENQGKLIAECGRKISYILGYEE